MAYLRFVTLDGTFGKLKNYVKAVIAAYETEEPDEGESLVQAET